MTDMINFDFMEDLSELLNSATGHQRRHKTLYEIDTEFEKMTVSLLKNFNCRFQGLLADKCTRVGREEEGTSSNRPELGGVVLALQMAALSEDVLLLCDNKVVLRVIKKWVG
jgi:hypothetical protein